MDLFTLETMGLARSFEQLSAGFRWEVPARFNLAWDCCGRHAAARERFALYFEDEDGTTAAFSFWDIQQAANRLSNAMRALGVQRGQRIAILLPQRPETAIAHVAAYQMGAIALPLSHLFGPDALEYRLRDAGACVAIVDPDTLPKLWTLRARTAGTHPRYWRRGSPGSRRAGVGPTARQRESPLPDGRYCGGRPGHDHLHQRHHRVAERRADPAPGIARQSARVHLLA